MPISILAASGEFAEVLAELFRESPHMVKIFFEYGLVPALVFGAIAVAIGTLTR
jgi:hypothetical protein